NIWFLARHLQRQARSTRLGERIEHRCGPAWEGSARVHRGALPMQNALLVGLSRQMSLQHEMAVVANTIANIDTNGFKADFSLFEEYLIRGGRDPNFHAADSPVSFVHDRGTLIDLNQGPFQRTGNPLDVAINGDGFLVINTPQGERYTRNGALEINPQGELVTSEGYQVLAD